MARGAFKVPSLELDDFDHTMGWTFRNLNDNDRYEVHPDVDSAEYQELSRTAFGNPIDLPSEFVSPQASLWSHGAVQRQDCITCDFKRNLDTAETKWNHHPIQARRAIIREEKRSSDFRTKLSNEKLDINFRRKLREDIGNGRLQVLHDAAAKEAQLRAAHKWVYDKAEHPSRRQAWDNSNKESPQKQAAAVNADKKTTCRSREANRATNCHESKPGLHASLASSCGRNNRTLAPSKAPAKPARAVKSSLVPNVSEWRTQAFPAHPSPEAALAKQKREECQRLQKQWREAKEMQETIAEFETRMKQQWAI